jgi:ABC-type phosphate transport system substrate-binding protein
MSFQTILSLVLLFGNSFQKHEPPTVHLNGAGASVPATVYRHLIPMYKATRVGIVNLDMSYNASGSGNGIQQLINGSGIEYAGFDAMKSNIDHSGLIDFQVVPVIAGLVSH